MTPFEQRQCLIAALNLPRWYVLERLEMSNEALEGLVVRGYVYEPCECGDGTGRILVGYGYNRCECHANILIRHPNLKEHYIKNAQLR